jgi:AraC family transcriptional regulator
MHYAAGITHPRHEHEEMQISVVLRGTYTEEAHGSRYCGSVADVVFKPAGTPHADEFAGTRIISVTGSSRDLGLGGYAWHRSDAATTAGLRVARQFVEGVDLTDALDELFAALAPRPYRDHALAVRAAQTLDDSYAEPVSLRDLAADLRVHPVWLARAFRARWSCAPREYLQRVRVRAAAQCVTSSRRPLADIALDCGFSDQAHMTRLFARVLGITPSAMRRLSAA